jgi:hypothetical protein
MYSTAEYAIVRFLLYTLVYFPYLKKYKAYKLTLLSVNPLNYLSACTIPNFGGLLDHLSVCVYMSPPYFWGAV